MKSYLYVFCFIFILLGCKPEAEVPKPVQPASNPVSKSVVQKSVSVAPAVSSPPILEKLPLPQETLSWQAPKPITTPIVSEKDFQDVFIDAPEKTDLSSCFEEVCFHEEVQILGEHLFLKGIGTRKVLNFDIYTAAFYLSPEGSEDIEQMTEFPVAMVLEYQRKIDKKKVIETIYNNIADNPNVNLAEVKPQFDELEAAFDPPGKGSRYEFIYLPNFGLTMMKDGEVKVTLPGDDFAYAFFGIWFGDHLTDTKMKQYLLGRE